MAPAGSTVLIHRCQGSDGPPTAVTGSGGWSCSSGPERIPGHRPGLPPGAIGHPERDRRHQEHLQLRAQDKGQSLLPQIRTPVQIIAGAHDKVVPAANAEFLQQRLPHSELDIVDAGHFTWEDAAGEYAALITSWWAGGHEATPRTPASH